MNKKRKYRSPLDDFADQILLTGEIFLVAGAQKLIKDNLGLDISGITSAYYGNAQNSTASSYEYQKQQTILSKLRSEELRAANQAKVTEIKAIEAQYKLEQVRKEQPNYLVQRTETDTHSVTEIVSGILSIPAASNAFGSEGQAETIQNLLDGLLNRITLTTGRQGSGKTGLNYALAENIHARHNLPVYLLGAPKDARLLLPDWIKIAHRLLDIPNDAVILIDEFALRYLSLQFNSTENVEFREQIMLARQRGWTILACGQCTADMDLTIARQATCVFFKEPGLNQAALERREFRQKASRASEFFRKIPLEKRVQYAYVVDQNGFEGLISCALPSFWSQELSTIYGRGKMLTPPNKFTGNVTGSTGQSKVPNNVLSDEEILKFRAKTGYGIDKTAKELGCTPYRVRQCFKTHGVNDDE